MHLFLNEIRYFLYYKLKNNNTSDISITHIQTIVSTFYAPFKLRCKKLGTLNIDKTQLESFFLNVTHELHHCSQIQ